MRSMTKYKIGRKVLISFSVIGHHQRKLRQDLKQRKNLEAIANAEVFEECSLMAYSF